MLYIGHIQRTYNYQDNTEQDIDYYPYKMERTNWQMRLGSSENFLASKLILQIWNRITWSYINVNIKLSS